MVQNSQTVIFFCGASALYNDNSYAKRGLYETRVKYFERGILSCIAILSSIIVFAIREIFITKMLKAMNLRKFKLTKYLSYSLYYNINSPLEPRLKHTSEHTYCNVHHEMDEQEQLQRLALEECNVLFVDKLDISAILPHLISQHLLTDEDKQQLMKDTSTKVKKAQYLLDIIPRKAKGWFELFLECLRNSENGTAHGDLVKMLEIKFQELLESNVIKKKESGSGQTSGEQTQQPGNSGADGGVHEEVSD